MDEKTIKEIVKVQKEYFMAGETLSYERRLCALDKLLKVIIKREEDIEQALYKDLNKSPHESQIAEISLVIDEIKTAKRKLKSWMRKKIVSSPLTSFFSSSYTIKEPLGSVLIMSPWNYPFNLTFMPLVGAIAAGNCVILKTSNYSKHTSKIMKEIIDEAFNKEHICLIEGGRDVNKSILDERYDLIFFTGSTRVGKIVMAKASENLTPVILELGGKSPVIVDESADIKLAARRISFGKILNSGQTCVAPDYLLIDERVKEDFILEYKKNLKNFFHAGDYSKLPKIVNEKHFERLLSLLEGQETIHGGKIFREDLKIEPSLVECKDTASLIMEEEIFGPILPVISYKKIEEALEFIRVRPKPLALYLFTRNKKIENRAVKELSYGGGCINDTVIQLSNPKLPFGGVGNSGMGSYHGKRSFDSFSHEKSILKKAKFFDFDIRYQPYDNKKLRIFKKLNGR